MQISDKLESLKKQNEIKRKPFPLWAALILYHNGPRTLYNDYFSDYKILLDWLSPIEIDTTELPIPRLHRTYEIQELAKHLHCTQGHIEYGYQIALIKLQFPSYFSLMSKEISTVPSEFKGE